MGTRWAQGGHSIVFSSREPDSPKMKELLASAGKSARAAGTAETVASSDVILLATPWPATQLRRADCRREDSRGKILIDAVNPLLPDLSALEIGTTTSAAEKIAEWAPGARVVKAFNTIGYPAMADPIINGETADLFYCGDDAAAKKGHGPAGDRVGV